METAVRKATRLDHQAPKQKHLQHLISVTHSSNVNLKDLFEMLQRRIRENSWIICFKALITTHTLMREGSGDKVIAFVEEHPTILDVSKLREKGNAGEHVRNIRQYSAYLEEKVLAYRDLHVDYVKTTANGKGGRLRRLPVSQGLLRETSILQRQISGLLKCQFSLDEIDNEITLQAFKLLVEDLLALFQAVNEGVINILEHYFAMSKPDARESLDIYKKFAKQTEAVIDYLSMAKRLQRDLEIDIPVGKHAPLSLATALEEYLQDPDYEAQRESAIQKKSGADSSKATATSSGPSNGSAPAATTSQPKELMDFFSSIESESATIYKDPQSSATFISSQPTGTMGGAGFGNAQASANPFRSSTMPMRSQSTVLHTPTGFGGMNNQQPQQPQFTGMPSSSMSSPSANPFRASTMAFPISSPYTSNNMQTPQQQQPSFTGMNSMMDPQLTGMTSQPTGMTNFTPSMQTVQSTGISSMSSLQQPQQNMFSGSNTFSPRMSVNPFMNQQQMQTQQQPQQPQQQPYFGNMQSPQMTGSVNPFAASMGQQQPQMTGQATTPNFQQPWQRTF
ncbi:hypothetical protein NQZ79_g7901 [Umbelopsis isabellina]|nr:hypothetical protein NQZ79_g7901 [Umbelopsis isabellina]